MLQLGIRGLGIARFKFNPISWFLKSEQGAWYDPSDLTTLFQDSAGTTPVTAVEQPVGLMLDKSKGLALGAELVTNGGPFTNTTDWVSRANCTLAVVGAELIGTGTVSGSVYRFYYQPVTVIGYTYKVTVNITSLAGTGDLLTVYSSAGAGQIASISIPTTGIYTIYFTATTTTTCVEFGDINSTSPKYTGISNISVKQIAGNHAFQATAGNRPLLSARVNLLTKTEDFSDVAWIKDGATVASNSQINIAAVSSGYRVVYQRHIVGVVTSENINIELKGVTGTEVVWIASTTNGATFTSKKCELTTDWKSYSILVSPSVGNNYFQIGVDLRDPSQTAQPSQTIFARKADLRPTNAGALLPPYQRVNTASDYDTVGFPIYLKANGTSSAMSTNSIDFTATDKMTVVTGVRKLSDANFSVFTELSIDLNANNNSFYIGNHASALVNAYGFASKGTVINFQQDDNTKIAPISNVITMQSSISTPQLIGRVDAITKVTSSGTQGAGTFGNYPLYLFARAGTSSYFNGQFYGAIIRGAQSDTASVTQTENYMATKTGIKF